MREGAPAGGALMHNYSGRLGEGGSRPGKKVPENIWREKQGYFGAHFALPQRGAYIPRARRLLFSRASRVRSCFIPNVRGIVFTIEPSWVRWGSCLLPPPLCFPLLPCLTFYGTDRSSLKPKFWASFPLLLWVSCRVKQKVLCGTVLL